MCECKTKIQFEINGGGLFSKEPLEENNCPSFNDCLDCTEIDENLKDGIYNAILNCSVYPVNYAEGIEYDGENILENIVKIEESINMLTCDKKNKEWIGTVMTNFDHSIDYEIANKLKESNSYADYPAWDFHGSVWFENGKYHCQIKRYGSHIATISNEDLQEIMNEASESFGES